MESTLYTHTVFSTGPRRVKLVHVKQGVFRRILLYACACGIAIRYQTAQDRAIFRRPGFPMLAMPRLVVPGITADVPYRRSLRSAALCGSL